MQNPSRNAENLEKELQHFGSTADMEEYMKSKLSPLQKEDLTALLQNPKALEKFLNTDEARALLKKLMGGNGLD